MKKLFLTTLFLLLLGATANAQVGFNSRADCAVLTPVANRTACLQGTTVSGRTAGQVYFWNGSAWVDIAAAAADAAAAALASHEADTTSIHGIADTANLETTSGAQTKVDTHVNDATAAHAASAVGFTPNGSIAATDVQAAIQEVRDEAAGGSQTPWTTNINAAGYTLFGNSTASGNLTLDSTSHATKGYTIINPTGGNVGIGNVAPAVELDVTGTINGTTGYQVNGSPLNFTDLAGTATAAQTALSVRDNTDAYCLDAVGSDAYACSLPFAPTSYVTGARYKFKAATINTGIATINFNGLGAKTIKKRATDIVTDLADGDICVGSVVELVYDGINMQMQSPLCNAPATTPGGSDTYVQFNDAGALGGDAGLTYNKTTDVLTVVGGTVSGDCTTNCLTHDTSAVTGSKTATWRDLTGTVAMTSDINKTRAISLTVGSPAGSTLTVAATTTSYVTVPFACTISAWNLLIDAGTITVKFWKVATGTAIPTSTESINTSGVAISTGTAIHSTTLTDFTSTAVTANDILAVNVTAVATAKFVNAVLECTLP